MKEAIGIFFTGLWVYLVMKPIFDETLRPWLLNYRVRQFSRRHGWWFHAFPSIRETNVFAGLPAMRSDESHRLINLVTCSRAGVEINLVHVAKFHQGFRRRYLTALWVGCAIRDDQLHLPTAIQSGKGGDVCETLAAAMQTSPEKLRGTAPQAAFVESGSPGSDERFIALAPEIETAGNKLALRLKGWPSFKRLPELFELTWRTYQAALAVSQARQEMH